MKQKQYKHPTRPEHPTRRRAEGNHNKRTQTDQQSAENLVFIQQRAASLSQVHNISKFMPTTHISKFMPITQHIQVPPKINISKFMPTELTYPNSCKSHMSLKNLYTQQ
jgi:hypothetical protein